MTAPTDPDARARARRHWPVRKHALTAPPGDDLSESTTAPARIAMVEALTREAWALTGRPIPDYVRAEAPVRLLHRAREAGSADIEQP